MRFGLALVLPETRGKSDLRQSILDYLKTFITNIDAVRKLEVTVKKRTIQVYSNVFGIYFDSTREFKMGFATDKEDAVQTINSILNEITKKLNEMENKKAKSEITLVCMLGYPLKKKATWTSFSKLLDEETLSGLKYKRLSFIPTQVAFETKMKKGRAKHARFRIFREEEENILELVLVKEYKDRFPVDIAKSASGDVKEFLNELLGVLGIGK